MKIQLKKQRNNEEESIQKVKTVYYPLVGFAFLVNSLIIIGVYYQNKTSQKNERDIEYREQLRNLSDTFRQNQSFLNEDQVKDQMHTYQKFFQFYPKIQGFWGYGSWCLPRYTAGAGGSASGFWE